MSSNHIPSCLLKLDGIVHLQNLTTKYNFEFSLDLMTNFKLITIKFGTNVNRNSYNMYKFYLFCQLLRKYFQFASFLTYDSGSSPGVVSAPSPCGTALLGLVSMRVAY